MDLFDLLLAVLLAVLVIGFAIFPGWRVNPRVVDRWAASAGLELSERGRLAVARYLRWSKRSRTFGGLAGLVIPYALWLLAGTPGQPPFPLGYVLLGYLAGSLLAEVVLARSTADSPAALLAPRRLSDYLSGLTLCAQRGLGTAAIVLGAAYALSADESPGIGPIVFGVAGGLGWLALEIWQRLIVVRRQGIAGAEDALLDDATRSHSVQAVAGPGLALLCFVVVAEIGMFRDAVSRPASTVENLLTIVQVVLLLVAVVFWVNLAEPRQLRTRRVSVSGTAA